MQNKSHLFTLGDIAKRLGIARHIADYAVERYRIEETQRAGVLRLFDEAAVERIRRAVRRTHGDPVQAGTAAGDNKSQHFTSKQNRP